jgi:hypothetical protein
MRTLIEMTHEVYGEHTFWSEAQLLRLKELERLVRADERERLKVIIALDKKAENARELGLDYEPAVQEPYKGLSEHLSQASGGMVRIDPVTGNVGIGTPEAQPAVQEGRDWSLLAATQESLREHMAEIKRLKAAQPAPVQDLPFGVGGGLVAIKTLLSRDPCVHANTAIEMIDAILKEHPVAPKPWVGLSEEEVEAYDDWADFQVGCGRQTLFDMVRDIEAKLREKNGGE